MSNLICYIPNHGYSDADRLYVSWLDDYYYVSDKGQDSFKLAIESGGSVLLQYTEDIISGYVRKTSTETAATTISGLDHLDGEDVYFVADGKIVGLYTVSSGDITVPSDIYISYGAGLPYTSTLKPMKLDIASLGLATTKKISRAIINLYNTIGGEIGTTTSNVKDIDTGTDALFTGHKEVPMPGGYSRVGDIIVRQTLPLPMTVVSLTLDVGVAND